MATLTSNLVCDNSSLANFKSWAQSISTAFSTFGWTQTTDTGQVNWSSIASVPSSTFVYEVWKAADALASTMPIFVKVEYGFSATSIQFRITVGTGSNGSGTINGITMSSTPWNISGGGNGNQGVSTFPCYFSGTAGEIRVAMWNSGNLINYFFIERSKDTSGNNTADYVTAGSNNSTTTIGQTRQQSISSTLQYVQGSGICNACPFLTTGFDNSTVSCYPCFPHLGKIGNPYLGTMVAYAADAATNTTVTVASMYGSTHTYIAIGGQTNFSSNLGARTATVLALMRYE